MWPTFSRSKPAGQFGLVQFAEGYEPFFIGLYGDFFDAFDAM
jgi:hypothetical protein